MKKLLSLSLVLLSSSAFAVEVCGKLSVLGIIENWNAGPDNNESHIFYSAGGNIIAPLTGNDPLLGSSIERIILTLRHEKYVNAFKNLPAILALKARPYTLCLVTEKLEEGGKRVNPDGTRTMVDLQVRNISRATLKDGNEILADIEIK